MNRTDALDAALDGNGLRSTAVMILCLFILAALAELLQAKRGIRINRKQVKVRGITFTSLR
jgi:hypothetical protein